MKREREREKERGYMMSLPGACFIFGRSWAIVASSSPFPKPYLIPSPLNVFTGILSHDSLSTRNGEEFSKSGLSLSIDECTS